MAFQELDADEYLSQRSSECKIKEKHIPGIQYLMLEAIIIHGWMFGRVTVNASSGLTKVPHILFLGLSFVCDLG